VLQVKVQAIKDKNLPPEKWTVSELNTMLQWYKSPSNTAMPSKKADKLARYYQICNRSKDPPEPEFLLLPPVPLVDSSNEDNQMDVDAILFDAKTTASEEGDNELLMRIDAMLTTEV